MTISATHGGLARTAVVYEAPPDAPRSPAMTAYPHLATVKVTFPPEAPAPPPPAIDVRVFRELGDVRVGTQGLVTVGEPLTIGLTVPASATNPATWLAPTVNGQAQAIQPDPLAGTPTGIQQIVSAPFVPAQAGAYTLVARAQPAGPLPHSADVHPMPTDRLTPTRAQT